MRQKTAQNKILFHLLVFILAGAFSLSIGIRFLGFYHLTTSYKLGLMLYLMILLSVMIGRVVLPWLGLMIPNRRTLLGMLGGAAALGAIFFLLVGYRITPLRTVHTLTIEHPEDSAPLLIEDILLPGDQRVELAAVFPDAAIESDALILPPGGSLDYEIERTGGLTLILNALDVSLQPEITWDMTRLSPTIPPGETVRLALDGASWGRPSLVYRVFGLANIAADGVSVGAAAFLVCALALAIFRKCPAAPAALAPRPAYAVMLVFSLGLVVAGALVYHFVGIIDWMYGVLFAAGGLFLGRLLVDGQVRRYLWAAMGVLALGILTNLFFWRVPPNPPLLYLQHRPDNSFAFLADRIGASNSTYLSIGYYAYLRESSLHISQKLYDELMLETHRLTTLNQLVAVEILDYDSSLARDQADGLFALGNWQSWPNRTGGTFYLQMDGAGAGETYCFFSDGLDYLIIPVDFLAESGVLDVSICD